LVVAVAACDNLAGLSGANGTPVAVVLMNARTKGGGYTTYPKLNFYSVGNAQFAFSTIVSDTCIAAAYDSTAVAANTATVIGGGAFVIAAVSADTDSLFRATTSDGTYRPTNTVGMSFNPGDSVYFNVPGDVAGFPPLQAAARTAEPYTISRPVIPPVGQPMLVQWTPATDNNAAMYVSLIYAANGGTSLNTQIFCDFHDDGQGTVQAYLLPALSSSNVPFVLKAQRVRTNLLLASSGSAGGYMNVISTFDFPTPVSP
jgi:hypothetical protein